MIEDIKPVPNSEKYHSPYRTVTLKNVRGHDLRTTFLQKENPTLSLKTYDPDGPNLRAENGLGELAQDTPEFIKYWEVFKAGRQGPSVDISSPDRRYPLENILSSRLYELKKDENGSISARFLQYRKPYGEPRDPIDYHSLSGRNHDGFTGNEVEAVIEVIWSEGIGIIIMPTIIDKRTFTEEIEYARTTLKDKTALAPIQNKLDEVRFNINELKSSRERAKINTDKNLIAA